MTQTLPTPTGTASTPPPAPTDAEGVRHLRWAGVAGVAWGALLVITNIINATIAPAPDAEVDTVLVHLTDDRTAIAWITAAFIVSVPLASVFIGGLAHELARRGARLAGVVAVLGFAGVFTMFGLTAATRLSLVAAVGTDSVEPSAIWTMWKLHDIVFAFNAAPLAVTFAAIGVACAATGLAPRAFRVVAPVGAALLLIGALFALQTAEGEMAGFTAGGIGFVTWVVFVLTLSVGMIRGRG